MKYQENDIVKEPNTIQEELGCGFCWDNLRKQEKKHLYFFDAANNFRACQYCPMCGRKYLIKED